MTTQEERDAERTQRDIERKQWEAEREQKETKRLRREATVRRIKDIVWSAVIASVITIIVLTSLGWLTTQSVVETARQQGEKEIIALRASICTVRFQQIPDATAKLAEFKQLSWSDKGPAIRKLVADEKLAMMPGEDAPAPGAIDKCADAISDLAR
jgi:hypothetical protein